MGAKVVVAMSGGVDSSVAAALLKEQGCNAMGVTLSLLPRAGEGFGCCGSPKDITDAKRVCEQLGISHYTLNFADFFEEKVIQPFVEAYLQAQTPNPCVECNRHVKFDKLLRLADAWEADCLATGHYARIERIQNSEFGIRNLLKKARDEKKDQSYFLYMLGQEQLSKTLFPLGELTKDQVRAKAKELELPTADKPDSQEICFVGKQGYRSFIKSAKSHEPPPRMGEISPLAERAMSKGPIVNKQSKVLGQHGGIINYTYGQREGLRIAAKEPLYVVDINPQTNTVVVGVKEEVYATSFQVENLSWVAGSPPDSTFPCQVKVRSKSPAVTAKVSLTPSAIVTLDSPLWAPTPGQSAVFYDGEVVLGGGIIKIAK